MTQGETGAAGESPGRGFRTHGDAPAPSSWDPDRWWSFGEAADRAGVTHRTLQSWAERGDLMVRTAWREGIEVRLVRAGDVARLAPDVARDQGEVTSLEERALFTGPRRSALGAGAAVPPLPAEGGEPERYEDDRDAWRRTAELEIQRLREDLAAARAARTVGREPAVPPPAAAMDLWSVEGGAEGAGPAVGKRGGPSWPMALAAGLLLGVALGASLDRVSLGRGAPDGEGSGGTVTPARDAVLSSSTQAAAGGAEVVLAGAAPAGEAEPSERLTDDPSMVAVPSSAVPSSAVPLSAVPSDGAESGAAAPDPGPTDVDPQPAGVDPARPVASDPPEASAGPARLRARLPLSMGDLPGRRAGALDGVTRCAFGAPELSSSEARGVLGPCHGTAGPEGDGVLATDRVGGVPCCKHHAAVQRLRGVAGDPRALEVATREAEQARRDGLVPPMLELRAERAAAPLVRHLLGGWRSSGLDGWSEGREHRWAEAPRGDDGARRLELTSWVERGEDGVVARYRLTIELSGGPGSGPGSGPGGDRALSFQWLD